MNKKTLLLANRLLFEGTNIILHSSENNLENLVGINSLITCAMPLILLIIRLKTSVPKTTVSEFRRQLLNEISNFETQAKKRNYSLRQMLAAQYCLCTVLDEVILLASWSGSSEWAKQTLLSLLYKETWGGERFFRILEKFSEDPELNLEVLELLYLLLSLGFEGKYYNVDKEVREDIRHKLFKKIICLKSNHFKELSSDFELKENNKKALYKNSKLNHLFFFASFIVFIFFISNLATYIETHKKLEEFNFISQTINADNYWQNPGLSNNAKKEKNKMNHPKYHYMY